MNVTFGDIATLVILCEAVGTIVLSVALLMLYRHSQRLLHVLPLAISYLCVLGVCVFRILGHPSIPTWTQWNIIGAFAVGDVGLLMLLSRTWPRRGE